MYLNRKTKCSSKALFDVPHKSEPVTAKYLEKRFPEFAKEMNGCSEECCLLYYWQRNKETKIYEFIDAEAEEEVRELLGVRLYDEAKEKEKAKQKYLQETRALTEQEIRTFKEELAYASQQMKEFNKNTTKTSLQEQQELDEEDLESSEESELSTTP